MHVYLKLLCLLVCLLCAGCDEGSSADLAMPQTVVDAIIFGSIDSGIDLDGALDQTSQMVRTDKVIDGQRVSINNGLGQVSFMVPSNALSITVIIWGMDDGWYGIDGWQDETGYALVPSGWPALEGNEAGCYRCNNFATQSAGVSTTIAPNRPGALINAGRHVVDIVGWVDGFAADEARVSVLIKQGPIWPATGTIDLNMYFTGAQGWTADSVQADPYFAACIDRVIDLYGRAGIRLGEIAYHDIDSEFATVSIEAGDDSLGRLVGQSVAEPHHGANVFFVDEILTGEIDFPSIPGVAAAVPSPPLLPGTVASGVAVATKGPLSVPPGNRFLDPPAIGQTIAHELGHALGLVHTSEYDGVTHDLFDDTLDDDNRYLMHADGTGAEISAQQIRALMANPVISHP
ncbi:MAG: hypothetical protein CMH52_03360 [Myxococcales bacterium]|nr:hypothetical protein [Myxococcales bacterium]